MIPDVKKYSNNIPENAELIIGADVGGTNTNICVAYEKNGKPELIFSFHYRTQTISTIVYPLKEVIRYAEMKYKKKPVKACIAGAGPVNKERGHCKLTNAEWDLDVKEIKKHTPLKEVMLINDFEAIGYGVNLLTKKEIKTLKKGKEKEGAKTVIGPGTGLGKAILVKSKSKNIYKPIASEGGHVSFPAQDIDDLELLESTRQELRDTPDYEDFLSGQGVIRIYEYLINKKKYPDTKYRQEISVSTKKELLIAKYYNKDSACSDTFKWLTKLLARCAKNYALETVSTGGVYLAGGIAINNKENISKGVFEKEFIDNRKMKSMLKEIPVYIVLNYDISLKGACLAIIKEK